MPLVDPSDLVAEKKNLKCGKLCFIRPIRPKK